MLRYLKAVQMMKQIINENDLTVMATVARYACAYEAIAKPDWWDKSRRSALPPYYSNPFIDTVATLQRGPHHRARHALLRSLPLLRR